jgi:hypothetical protein
MNAGAFTPQGPLRDSAPVRQTRPEPKVTKRVGSLGKMSCVVGVVFVWLFRQKVKSQGGTGSVDVLNILVGLPRELVTVFFKPIDSLSNYQSAAGFTFGVATYSIVMGTLYYKQRRQCSGERQTRGINSQDSRRIGFDGRSNNSLSVKSFM